MLVDDDDDDDDNDDGSYQLKLTKINLHREFFLSVAVVKKSLKSI